MRDNRVSSSPLKGNSIDSLPLPSGRNGQTVVSIRGAHNGKASVLNITSDDIEKHTLLVGATGCGKTTLLYKYVHQIRQNMSPDDVMIIFDSKGDYFKKFFNDRTDVVIGNTKESTSSTVSWNIFREIVSGHSTEDIVGIRQDAHEICKSLFLDKVKNSSNQFFPNAARDLLTAIIFYIINKSRCDKVYRTECMNNGYLKKLLLQSNSQKLTEMLALDDDNLGVLSYISSDAEAQAAGVMAEMNLAIQDILVGAFGNSKGNFSIRDFVRARKGRTLFIEYDISLGNTLTPVYRLLFDLALKEAMASGNQNRDSKDRSRGNVYMVCDEFRLLPNLQHIDNAVNFGRSLGLKVIAGLQSIEQIYDAYGKSHGNAIIAGFSNLFVFRTNDWATRSYFSDLFGKNVCIDVYTSLEGRHAQHIREGRTVEDWQLNSLKIGEAVVSLPFELPFIFHFDK